MFHQRRGFLSGRGVFVSMVPASVLVGTAAVYAAHTCYCDSGPHSACLNHITTCGSGGAYCEVDSGGSTLIYEVVPYLEIGFPNIATGAIGNCVFYTGTCSYTVPVKCLLDDSGAHTRGVTNSTATGSPPCANCP